MNSIQRIRPYLLPSTQGIITSKERILILGANGWFGKTFRSMLDESVPCLFISSVEAEGSRQWDQEIVQNFKPTLVANFAFKTRHKLSSIPRAQYISENLELLKRLEFASNLTSVKAIVTVSSGAATHPLAQQGLKSVEIYGALKKLEEEVVKEAKTDQRASIILRAYSVSGPFVRDKRKYAFSSFIDDAARGEKIVINSPMAVFRRYISVGDLLLVALIRASQGWSGVIESGGQLLEIEDLARLISASLGGSVTGRTVNTAMKPDYYFSDNMSWEQNITELGFEPLTLLEQISSTAKFLRS